MFTPAQLSCATARSRFQSSRSGLVRTLSFGYQSKKTQLFLDIGDNYHYLGRDENPYLCRATLIPSPR